MKQIVFEQPVVKQDISNKEVYTHIFKGNNFSSNRIKIKDWNKNCSCTGIEHPEVINPGPFEVKMNIDKRGLTGLFLSKAVINFSNNEQVELKINGKITD